MNHEKLDQHIAEYNKKKSQHSAEAHQEYEERRQKVMFYQKHDRSAIINMTEEQLYHYIADLWAMLIWGNKQYVIDKLIDNNGFEPLKQELAELVHGDQPIEERWSRFRSRVKGMGPAMISEILCKTWPDKYMLWNRRAWIALNYLEVDDLPKYDYQITGKRYRELCRIGQQISDRFRKQGIDDNDLLAIDYFFWTELQFDKTLDHFHRKTEVKGEPEPETEEEAEFIHNEVRDKLWDIGQWLGFITDIEKKVAEGSVVDTVWEATIGNMGRVIYVFEVQTKGNIDGLMINLIKSLNNPAVLGIVAVSDTK